MAIQQKITPYLWFDGTAEEAAKFYVSIFPNSRIVAVSNYPEAGPGEPGTVMVVVFELEGQTFGAINGGTTFKLSEATSFLIDCATQAEIDHYWSRLLEGGGTEQPCGWLKDRYGMSWQVNSQELVEKVHTSGDTAAIARVMAAMMEMGKIDLGALERAYAG
jgi:predicted 3-demethylubiquinone-9 3-methyltransferase (glyoxalase superfamily)